MAMTVGISPNMVYVLVFGIGSLLAGVAAIFQAMDTAASPNMGFQPIFIAFVVGFLGGLYKVIPVALAGLFIGLLEYVPSTWIQAKWSPLLVFGALFIYMIILALDMKNWEYVKRGREMIFRRSATAA
jgi:branched-chain amino acid transport system permease protein